MWGDFLVGNALVSFKRAKREEREKGEDRREREARQEKEKDVVCQRGVSFVKMEHTIKQQKDKPTKRKWSANLPT